MGKIKELVAQLNSDDSKQRSTKVTSNDDDDDEYTSMTSAALLTSSYFPYLSLSTEASNRTTLGRLFNFSRNKKKDQTAAPVPKLNSQQMHLIPSTRQSASPAAPATAAVQAGHRPQLVTPTRQ